MYFPQRVRNRLQKLERLCVLLDGASCTAGLDASRQMLVKKNVARVQLLTGSSVAMPSCVQPCRGGKKRNSAFLPGQGLKTRGQGKNRVWSQMWCGDSASRNWMQLSPNHVAEGRFQLGQCLFSPGVKSRTVNQNWKILCGSTSFPENLTCLTSVSGNEERRNPVQFSTGVYKRNGNIEV